MLVSAIMPTRGRPQYAAEALQCLLWQTYQDKELVIVDDADDPSFPTMSGDAEFGLHDGAYPENIQIKYYRLSNRLTIGAKRNLACSRASGEVICHWDDDDWSAPERIKDQIDRLKEKNAQITGYSSMRFLHVETGEWWKYAGHQHYALGTSLCYYREWWKTHQFPNINEGEDNAVVNRAGKIATADAGEMMWARTHPGNTSKRKGVGVMSEWTRVA